MTRSFLCGLPVSSYGGSGEQRTMSPAGKGTAASLTASCLFGLIYYYATLLSPLSGIAIFGWRIIFTLPFLLAFIYRSGYGHMVKEIMARVGQNKKLIPALGLSSFLLGVQHWLFMWAPINGKALEVSLGFLLMPLVMVLCGKIFYREQLRPFQKMAVMSAALGVGYKVWQMGGLSLQTLIVCLGFPAYFMLRKALKTENIGGLLIDLTLMLPASVYILWLTQSGPALLPANPKLLLLLPALGAITALSVACYVTASKLLSFSIFGLLSYVEPILLVLVAILLGEKIAAEEIPTYVGVFLAVFILAVGVWLDLRIKKRSSSAVRWD